jgi:glycerol-3-phosphate cytidylyltransferase
MRVLTMGTFDIFHIGHLNLLRACSRIAGPHAVIVGLNTDEFIREYKGEHPVNKWIDRWSILMSTRGVTNVVANDSHDSKVLIDEVRPECIVIGTDWATKDYYAQIGVTQAWLDERNILMVYVPYTEGISSSKLRRFCVDVD